MYEYMTIRTFYSFLVAKSEAEPVHLPLDQVRDQELRHHGPWHPDVLHSPDKLLTLTPGAGGQGDDEHDVLGQVNTKHRLSTVTRIYLYRISWIELRGVRKF